MAYTCVIPAPLARKLGLANEGDSVELYVQSIQDDGSVVVETDQDMPHGEGESEPSPTEPTDEGSMPPPPKGAPKGIAIIAAEMRPRGRRA